MDERACTTCKASKPVDQFRQRPERKSPNSRCIDCERADTARRARDRSAKARGGKYTCQRCGFVGDPEAFARVGKGGHTCKVCHETPACRTCGERKPRDQFYIRPSGTLFGYVCIACYKVGHAEIYRLRKADDPALHILYVVKARAKEHGLACDLTIEDVVIPEFCPVRGVKLLPVGPAPRHDDSPSIDRVDNAKGYVRGNVRVISFRANILKRDGTLEEFEQIVRYMRSHGAP